MSDEYVPDAEWWASCARAVTLEQLQAYAAHSIAINGFVVLHPALAKALRETRPELWAAVFGEDSKP